jgi:hypothetical protein
MEAITKYIKNIKASSGVAICQVRIGGKKRNSKLMYSAMQRTLLVICQIK